MPSLEDRQQVAALMVPFHEAGEFAPWIAAPAQGINQLAVEYDYVRF